MRRRIVQTHTSSSSDKDKPQDRSLNQPSLIKMSIKPSTPQDFANSMAELEQILKVMEQGELSLEDSLLKYEDGIKLIRACQQTLDKAQQKIKTLNTNNLLDDTQNDK